jgi:hypothetical protein
MLLLIAEIASLVFGIIAVSTGKFSLSKNKVVTGAPARVVGVFLILPLPLALMAGLAIAAMLAARGEVIELGRAPVWTMLLELGIFLACFTTAMVIAAVNAHPPEGERRRYDAYDDRYDAPDAYEEDYDRRRRPPEDPYRG